MQVCGETLESAHGFWIAVRPHGNVMRTIAHIDTRSVGMDHLQDRCYDTRGNQL
jgi:hypothetical protein